MRLEVGVFVSVCIAATAAGSVADGSQPVSLPAAPAAVQKVIAAQVGDGKVENLDHSEEGGESVYDVDFTTRSGERRGFSVAADGTLLSTEVSLAETPAAVQKTIQAQAAGGQLDGIDRSVEATGATYDVEVAKAGRAQSFTVDDDGTLLSIAMALDETPAAVQKAILAEVNGGQIDRVDKNLDDTEITFDVETTRNGATQNFTVSESGVLTGAAVALADTPPAVQATIAKQGAGGVVKSIDRDIDPAGDTFDVEVQTKEGAKSCFTVGAGGGLRSVEVTLEQIPPAPRKTIQDQIGGGKIIQIDKELVENKDKVLPYEVEGRKDGKPFDFSVGPKGRFLGMDP